MKDIRPLYIIPARGGSKGLPRKNIAMLCGKPLLAYTIEAARKSVKGEIILSTEDAEIAEVGRAYGLEVRYMRPLELAGDEVGSRVVMLDVMDYADREGIEYNCVVLLQPTSPLRTSEDINGALERYSADVDMVVSVSEASANPYYDCYEEGADGYLAISKGEGRYIRRQDVPAVWQYNGAVYVINPESLRRGEMWGFRRRVAYVMPRSRGVDIDDREDMAVAERIMKNG